MCANGEMSVVELPALCLGDHPQAEHVVERRLYRWLPPSDLVPKLPNEFSVALESWLFRDGVRRFTPADSQRRDFSGYVFYDATAFALEASVGGRALLWKSGQKPDNARLTFDEARLFMQYAQHLREHLGPTRKLADALNLCASARHTRGEIDVLPADIGLDANGEGERWSVSRLKEEGRHAARQRGIESPTENDIVRLGLLAAAEANPLPINDKGSEFITRSVVFRLPAVSAELSNEVLDFVAGQVRKSLDKKLDVSNDEFRNWIEDPRSNLIRSIQRASKDKLTREQIKAALIELAWQAVKSFGTMVDAQMHAFRDAIPEALSPQEDLLFKQSFLANPIFGGLPLILLHDRFDILNEVVPEFWNEPADARGVQKIRTMLYYYGVIVGNLRDAEALYKRRTRKNSSMRGSFWEEQLVEKNLSSPSSRQFEVLYDAARACAVESGRIPESSADEWSVKILSSDDTSVTSELFHSTGQTVSMVVPRDEFDARAQKVKLESEAE